MISAMQHLNNNLLCAIDTETTGLRSGYNDAIEVCILPLNGKCEPMGDIPPFNMRMKPARPENVHPRAMAINKIKLEELTMSPEQVSGLFEEWFEVAVVGNGFKKIAAIGHNYASFDKGFIREWLGYYTDEPDRAVMDDFFDGKYCRDTIQVVQFLNDLADKNAQKVPFPKYSLSYLCNIFEIERVGSHTALGDAMDTARVYQKLLEMQLGFDGVAFL